MDTYDHLLPGSDESTRTAIDAVMQERAAEQECDSAAERLPGVCQQQVEVQWVGGGALKPSFA